jgi:hypothetical protein
VPLLAHGDVSRAPANGGTLPPLAPDRHSRQSDLAGWWPGDFVTAFIGVLDPDTGEVSYCNAGHNPPVLMAPDGSYRLLEVGGPILGILKDAEWTEGRFRITDEVLVCYTDGATEARNVADEEYGEERLIQTVRANLPLMPYRLCTALYASVRTFTGAAKHGDDDLPATRRGQDGTGRGLAERNQNQISLLRMFAGDGRADGPSASRTP